MATSDNAECTALRSSTMPIAPASATGPRIQNVTASPVETVGQPGEARSPCTHAWCPPTSIARPVIGSPATLASLCGAPLGRGV